MIYSLCFGTILERCQQMVVLVLDSAKQTEIFHFASVLQP
jgi:hypothetical protein